METRSLLKGLPARPGTYPAGIDAVVEILEASGDKRHPHIRGVHPPRIALEEGFRSGPVFAYRLEGAVANLATGAVYDRTGALIEESFGTVRVLERYLPRATLPPAGEIATSPWPILPLATTRMDNYCRWWLDTMAKAFVVGRSVLAAQAALPMIHGAARGFQLEGLRLLDDVRLLSGRAPVFHRGTVVDSPGVTYGGGQHIGALVVPMAHHFAGRLARAPDAAAPPAKRLYVSRARAAIRCVADEPALAAALANAGFASIMLEDLSLAEQAAAFAGAEVIVAPHGAGLTNLLWAQPGTMLIELFPAGGLHGSAFLRIASHMGLPYLAMVGGTGANRDRKNNPNNADIVIDADTVVRFVRKAINRGRQARSSAAADA